MTARPSAAELFDDLRADLGRLADLSSKQRLETEDLERALRAGITTALADARTVKDSAADARRHLDALVGRIDRLAVRAQVETENDTPAAPSAEKRVADVGRAIDAAARDVASAETAWQWVERTNTSLAHQAATAIKPAAAPPPPSEEPAPESKRVNRMLVVVVAVAVLALVVVVALIVI